MSAPPQMGRVAAAKTEPWRTPTHANGSTNSTRHANECPTSNGTPTFYGTTNADECASNVWQHGPTYGRDATKLRASADVWEHEGLDCHVALYSLCVDRLIIFDSL